MIYGGGEVARGTNGGGTRTSPERGGSEVSIGRGAEGVRGVVSRSPTTNRPRCPQAGAEAEAKRP